MNAHAPHRVRSCLCPCSCSCMHTKKLMLTIMKVHSHHASSCWRSWKSRYVWVLCSTKQDISHQHGEQWVQPKRTFQLCLALDDCSSNSMQAFSTRLFKAMRAFAIDSSVNSAKFCKVRGLSPLTPRWFLPSSAKFAKECEKRRRSSRRTSESTEVLHIVAYMWRWVLSIIFQEMWVHDHKRVGMWK